MSLSMMNSDGQDEQLPEFRHWHRNYELYANSTLVDTDGEPAFELEIHD